MNGDWDLTPDISRKQRLGFDETIFCASKTPDQIDRLIRAAMKAQEPLLLTRLDGAKFSELPSELSEHLDYDRVSHTAILGRITIPDDTPRVAIISGGSSDVRVAREAARTLQYYRVGVREIYDVGVAGLWRLLEHVDEHVLFERRERRPVSPQVKAGKKAQVERFQIKIDPVTCESGDEAARIRWHQSLLPVFAAAIA